MSAPFRSRWGSASVRATKRSGEGAGSDGLGAGSDASDAITGPDAFSRAWARSSRSRSSHDFA